MITHVPCGGKKYDPAGRLLIFAFQEEMDGAGGNLGGAAPDYVSNECPGISHEGRMVLDAADLAVLTDRQLGTVYLHEIGHVIGVGSVVSKAVIC